MILQFKLRDVLEVDLYYGFYDIFVVGGFDVQANPDFFVEILDLKTNESILLKEKNLKSRDYKNGRRAVKFFSFQVTEKSTYRISVHNYEDIAVFNSMLGNSPFSFLRLLKKAYGIERKPLQLDEIEILIT